MPSIVDVVITQTIAPAPATLQQTGAMVSQGGSILTPGQSSLLTQLSDLTPLLNGALPLASLTWALGIVTATTSSPHGFAVGDEIELTIAGAVPSGYNGTFLCQVTGASTFVYFVASNPGSETTPGTYTEEDVGELLQMATTFFAQGAQVGVYVLELGAIDDDDAIAALGAYLTANPNTAYVPGATGFFYRYLVPRSWDANTNFLDLLIQYNGLTSRTYFNITTKLSTYNKYTTRMKSGHAEVEAIETGVWATNPLTALTYTGGISALGATVAVGQSGSGNYNIGNTLTLVGGAGTSPTFTVTDGQVMTATVNAGGASGTPGSVTITGTSGTGTKFQATGTISGGGALTGPLVVTVPGDYTVRPTLVGEAVTGGGLVGATVDLKFGVLAVALASQGAMSTLPINPVATTVSPGGGTGCTLNINWLDQEDPGYITATTTNPHGVAVGDAFQLAGCTPIGYNGWYVAQAGTTGSTLVASLAVNPGAESVLGALVGSPAAYPGVSPTEFSEAAAFWTSLHYQPAPTNRVGPFVFTFVAGVTPFPTQGMNPTLTALQAANIGYIGTGAEGGISNTILLWGKALDGKPMNYWYSVDFAAINSDIALSNVVINGSNNPINPLYYNQQGINRLQDAVVALMGQCISVGLAFGQVVRTSLDSTTFQTNLDARKYAGQIVVNAIPLLPYLAANPADYAAGRYAGLSVQYIPSAGFDSIVFNLNVTDLIVP